MIYGRAYNNTRKCSSCLIHHLIKFTHYSFLILFLLHFKYFFKPCNSFMDKIYSISISETTIQGKNILIRRVYYCILYNCQLFFNCIFCNLDGILYICLKSYKILTGKINYNKIFHFLESAPAQFSILSTHILID